MTYTSILRQIINENSLKSNSIPKLDVIELSRLSKVSRGLASSYWVPDRVLFRQYLYATIYHTIKDNKALFIH
jgi:hypothetical protein